MAILQATLELLAEVGYRALTVEQVRDRAGVGKATIYRRYGNKYELVRAAIDHLHHDLPVPEDTGSLRTDIRRILEAATVAAHETNATVVVPRLLAESAHEPELQALFYENIVAPRRRVIRTVFERGIERGEVREDLDVEIAMDMLVGSIMYRGLISGMDTARMQEHARAVFDTLMSGIAPR